MHIDTTITRRSLLAATPLAAAAVAIPANATTGDDTAIIAAWERRKAAYLEFNAHPLIGEGTDEGDDLRI